MHKQRWTRRTKVTDFPLVNCDPLVEVMTESKNIVSNIIIDYPGAVYDVQKIPYSSVVIISYLWYVFD